MTDRVPKETRRTQRIGDLAVLDREWTVSGDLDTRIAGIAYNSKQVAPGDLFVALRGGYFDGHAFAWSAVERGAAALLTEQPLDLGVPEIVAPNTRAALAPVAAEFYGHPSHRMTVVGITGTDGKTTTSYLLEAILRDAGKRSGLIGTIAIKIDDSVVEEDTRQTTPESLDVQRHLANMADRGVEIAIVEATSHGLDLHRLDAVRFGLAGVTNITREHLEHHKTIAAYRRAKAKLFERIAENHGVGVINLDDEGAREMQAFTGNAKVLRYSIEDSSADLSAESISLGVDGSRFNLVYDDCSIPVQLPMLGAYNVSNALCAAGLALSLGVGFERIAGSLHRAPAVSGRMERVDAGQPFSVVVDYAHTPESLSKVLSLLRSLNPDGRLIVVSGSAGERDVEKRPLQGAVCTGIADFSIFTTEDPRCEEPELIIQQIADGSTARGAVEGRDFMQITDRGEAIHEAMSRAEPGDVVLLAGKGHERSIIWGLEKRPWHEANAARSALAELGFGACR